MGVLSLTIGGVAYVIGTSLYDVDGRFEITTPANGTARLSCSVVAEDVANVPTLDQEIILSEDGGPIFGGFIQEPTLKGINGHPTDAVVADISALDYNTLPSRRYVISLTIAAGTLKAALQAIVSYIDGVTLDAAQVDGPALPAYTWSKWTVEQILNQLTTDSGGYTWRINASKVLAMRQPGSVAAPFNVTAGDDNVDGDVIVTTKREKYANYVMVIGTGVTSTASNAGEITARGRWELVVEAPDVTTQAAADALSAAVLAASLPIVKIIEYPTLRGGVEPGMTQTVNLPKRGVNNTFIFTEVITRGRGPLITRTIKAIEGLVYKTGWREDIKAAWGGSGSGVTLPGLGGGSVGVRLAYFLGGMGNYVRSATPTWVDASPIEVQLSGTVRGTTVATITAMLGALEAGVSVQARLFDVTAGAPCPGLSAVVTSTSLQRTVWTVTIDPASHYYRLQVLPGTANADVAALGGYIE